MVHFVPLKLASSTTYFFSLQVLPFSANDPPGLRHFGGPILLYTQCQNSIHLQSLYPVHLSLGLDLCCLHFDGNSEDTWYVCCRFQLHAAFSDKKSILYPATKGGKDRFIAIPAISTFSPVVRVFPQFSDACNPLLVASTSDNFFWLLRVTN